MSIVEALSIDALNLIHFWLPKESMMYVLKKMFEKSIEEARNIILKELRNGDFSNVNDDVLVSVFYNLYNYTIEGRAKNNIMVLSRLIAGLNEHKQLSVPNFLKFSDILSKLNQDELFVVAAMVKQYHLLSKSDFNDANKKYEFKQSVVRNAMGVVSEKAKTNNEPADRYSYCFSALLRTGFVTTNFGKYGASLYVTTFFEELVKFIPKWDCFERYDQAVNE